MAELADALDSGSSEFTLMQVQVLLSAPTWKRLGNRIGMRLPGLFVFVDFGAFGLCLAFILHHLHSATALAMIYPPCFVPVLMI